MTASLLPRHLVPRSAPRGRIGARALGVEDAYGTVEAGKAADLLLLDADPRVEIRATRAIRHVVQGGRIVR